jgi:hypothetical protein
MTSPNAMVSRSSALWSLCGTAADGRVSSLRYGPMPDATIILCSFVIRTFATTQAGVAAGIAPRASL